MKVIVLDRDGVINRKLRPRQYLRSPADVEYLPGVKDSLRRLADRGFAFVIATNQMGIGLGLVTVEEVEGVNAWIREDLARDGVRVLGAYVCPHIDADGCGCRKPKPGLLARAAADAGVPPSELWNIGDSPRDILAGQAAGCRRNILVRTGYEPTADEQAAVPDVPTVNSLAEAADLILNMPAADPLAKIKSLDEVAAICRDLQSRGKTVALCHGVFDLLHPGHIRHLRAAKNFADILVVTLTRDAYVNKGPGRPAFTEALRAETLAAIESVDYVALNDPAANALPVIEKIRPDVYVKGSEYANAAGGVTGNRELERQAVESYGGRVAFTNEVTFSSTNVLNQYFNVYPEEAQLYLRDFRTRYRPEDVLAAFEKLRGQKVLVIGDAVIDEYHYTTPLGKAGKESLVVSKYQNEESFAGGIFALANHVASFCGEVALATVLGGQDSREEFIRARLKPNVQPTFFTRDDAVTTVKRRFVDAQFINKLYEIYYFDDSPLPDPTERAVWQYLAEELPKYDCVIVLDYAHGFLSNNLINLICSKARFLAVNTQTNAGNSGFNLITKYPRVDYACISEPELRLAFRDRHSKLESLVRKLSEQLSARRVTITRGPRGSLAYTPEGGFFPTPVLSQKVLDRVGAGDALLAVCAPAVAAGIPMELVGFAGGVSGAIAVTIVGNKTAVEYADVARTVKAMLS